MHDLVIHNVRLYPMSGASDVSPHDQIAIKDGLISAIGTESIAGRLPATDYLDARQACLLPGLIDCHTHIVYAGDRAREHEMRIEGAAYAEIHASGGGIHSSVKAVHAADPQTLIAESLPRIRNLQKEGVTTLEIKSGYGLDHENEIKMLRVISELKKTQALNIVSTFLGAHSIPKHLTQDEYLDEITNKTLPQIADEQLADAVDIYVEHIAFDNKAMHQLFASAKKHGLKTRVHAEQLSNQQAAATAAELGALSADHLEYLDEFGAKSMAKFGTTAVILPSAFYFLQETKKPPIALLRKHRVPMAVATDTNPGTSPIPSILTAMHLAVHLFGLSTEEALLGVTCHAAKALGLENSVGCIEVGKQADLGLWRMSSPDVLCYQLSGIYPEKIWHKGKLVA